jgi:hypothetical protein
MNDTPFTLWTIHDLRNRPPLHWLVYKVIPMNAQALLFGPPWTGKTFDAMDLAMSVATGAPW